MPQVLFLALTDSEFIFVVEIESLWSLLDLLHLVKCLEIKDGEFNIRLLFSVTFICLLKFQRRDIGQTN